ncbi:MAG: hypothetical protein J2P43_12135 [Candidatus Dormibacteraeota bacterium]|nr:hypothetical protein [Candidatus Dormibacteraeota bacterium]
MIARKGGKRRRSQQRDRRPRAAVAALVAAQIVIGSITVRDIRRRPPELVRGPRLLWMVWAGTNMMGSAAYWLLGRRRTPRTAAPEATSGQVG